jgi:hypothetical protein
MDNGGNISSRADKVVEIAKSLQGLDPDSELYKGISAERDKILKEASDEEGFFDKFEK